MELSVLMPGYNEAATLPEAVKAVLDVRSWPVSGMSASWSAAMSGIGARAAIRTAAQSATGDSVVGGDADLEYAPEEMAKLLQPALRGEAQVMYGTRTSGRHRAFPFWAGFGTEAEVTGKLLGRAPISQPHPPQRGSRAVDGQPGDGR